MNSKSVITAGIIWLGLVAVLGFVVLIMPQKKHAPTNLLPTHTAYRDTQLTPTPAQSVSTRVKIGAGAGTGPDGAAQAQVVIKR